MSSIIRSVMTVVLSATLLAGCQSSSLPPAPLAGTQLHQLASMVAAASWLRENCNRADIASNSELTRSALEQAKQRGWNIQQAEYQQLNAQIAERYQALMADSVSTKEKCTELNRATVKFLQKTQDNQ